MPVSLRIYFEKLFAYRGKTCCEYNNLVDFSHSLHKIINSRSFENIYIMYLIVDYDRNNKICIFHLLLISMSEHLQR